METITLQKERESPMAKQSKKIQHKIAPKKQETTPAPKPPGKDYVLLFVIAFTLGMSILGWGTFDNLNRGMYAMLSLSLIMTYTQRHAKLSEERLTLVSRIGLAAMILAIALFGVTLYQRYM